MSERDEIYKAFAALIGRDSIYEPDGYDMRTYDLRDALDQLIETAKREAVREVEDRLRMDLKNTRID